MNDTAIIAKSGDDFRVTAVYLESGAALHDAGQILYDHYGTPEKIGALLATPSISRLTSDPSAIRTGTSNAEIYQDNTGIDGIFNSSWLQRLQSDIQYIHHEGKWVFCRASKGIPLGYLLHHVRYHRKQLCCEKADNVIEHHIRHHTQADDNVYLTCFTQGWTDQDCNINLQNAELQKLNLKGTYWNYGQTQYESNHIMNTNYTLGTNKLYAPEGVTNLTNANLSDSDLSFANLQNCLLSGANLTNTHLDLTDLTRTNLDGANLQGAKLGKAIWGGPTTVYHAPHDPDFANKAHALPTLIRQIINMDKNHRTAYYRGEPRIFPAVMPALHRFPPATSQDTKEGKSLAELMRRQPEAFSNLITSFEQLAIARHYGLPTRFLDITANPLVAIWHATKPESRHVGERAGRLLIFFSRRGIPDTFQ